MLRFFSPSAYRSWFRELLVGLWFVFRTELRVKTLLDSLMSHLQPKHEADRSDPLPPPGAERLAFCPLF